MKKLLNGLKSIILSIFISSLFLIPEVLSDTVEIEIEYGDTTTSTTVTTTTVSDTTTTTTEEGDGGGNGGVGGDEITRPEEIVPGAVLTYSMPGSYKIYQNETGSFSIKVKNEGTIIFHDIRIGISGIPSYSYSVSPNRVGVLTSDESTDFYVSINPQNITPGTYSVGIEIVSDETYATSSLSLEVKEYTREIEKIIEDQEKIESEVKPLFISMKFVFIGVFASVTIMAAIILENYRRKRCPLCGGKIEKEYEGVNFISYKCSKCNYYKAKVKK